MTLELERELWEWIAEGRMARDKITAMVREKRIENRLQAQRTLEKWGEKGLYDWGVAVDMGWLVVDAVFPRTQ